MTIKIKVGEEANSEKTTSVKMSIDARKTIDGNIIVRDHNTIDIVIVPTKKKVVTFAKESYEDNVYGIQDRLFTYLASKGVINRDSVRAGNVYGSLEATYPEPIQGINAVQHVLLSIAKFIEEERPHMEFIEKMDDEFEKSLTNPDDEDSTDLGEVPHEEKKGSLPAYLDMYKSRRYYVSGIY